jgi:hypothetical protein
MTTEDILRKITEICEDKLKEAKEYQTLEDNQYDLMCMLNGQSYFARDLLKIIRS